MKLDMRRSFSRLWSAACWCLPILCFFAFPLKAHALTVHQYAPFMDGTVGVSGGIPVLGDSGTDSLSYPGLTGGFLVSGTFSFNATGGTADFTYTVDEQVLAGGEFLTLSSLIGDFATEMVGISTARITNYSEDTYLLSAGIGSPMIPGTEANVSAPISSGGDLLPYYDPSLGAGAPQEYTAQVISANYTLSQGEYTLHSTGDIQFAGLAPGETIFIDLPNGGGVAAAPVPSSSVLFGLGCLCLGVYGWRLRTRAMSVA